MPPKAPKKVAKCQKMKKFKTQYVSSLRNWFRIQNCSKTEEKISSFNGVIYILSRPAEKPSPHPKRGVMGPGGQNHKSHITRLCKTLI